MAINGKKQGFAKIIQLIGELVESLKNEQGDDDAKKEYCGKELDKTEDHIKDLKNSISNKNAAVEQVTDQSEKLVEEIHALKAGIAALDEAVAKATELRAADSADFKEVMTSNTAAKELILFAKNRLNKFYNPKMYKAPPKRTLSEGGQIFENFGGDIPTSAPGGIANTGIGFMQFASRSQEKKAPSLPPATAAAYMKKSEESVGVIAMMDLLVKDLDKQLTEAATEEQNSKEEYTQTIADSAEKRRGDAKALTDKEADSAELKDLLQKLVGKSKSLGKEVMASNRVLANLHGDCDWLVQYYDIRKQARSEEIDSLEKATAVLHGADFSLVQRSAQAHTFRQRT